MEGILEQFTQVFLSLSTGQIVMASLVALLLTIVIQYGKPIYHIFFRQDGPTSTYETAEVARVMKKCRELFPIETILFRGQIFKRGMLVRIVTEKNQIIEGEIIGKSTAELICIRRHNQIVAQQLERILEMTEITKKNEER